MSAFDIRTVFDLEQLDTNLFRGLSQDIGTSQVYGGQVLGQALQAALLTIEEERFAHSVHAYFLRKGDYNAPIIYQVEHSRDGRSFSARRVTAIQHGRPIFIMSASFQKEEKGVDYGKPMELPDRSLGFELPTPQNGEEPKFKISRYFDVVINDPANLEQKNEYNVWVKLRQPLADSSLMHRSILAYMSDFGILLSALVPHGVNAMTLREELPKYVMASIDHAMWFHRPFKVDEWFLYSCRPVSTSGARGLGQGYFYNEKGELFATAMQEGLIRLKD